MRRLRSTLQQEDLKRHFCGKAAVAGVNDRNKRRIVMRTTKNNQEQKRIRKKRAGAVDTYNPGNMAGQTTETCQEPSQKQERVNDDYDPGNMAGKKADGIKR